VAPTSASATSERIWEKAFGASDRFELAVSTYGGNPIACGAALNAVEVLIRDGLVENARKMGEYVLQKLQDLKACHKVLLLTIIPSGFRNRQCKLRQTADE
jgi:acetylornithine/succinyldiaminopimelate/putrescine aminotransferase